MASLVLNPLSGIGVRVLIVDARAMNVVLQANAARCSFALADGRPAIHSPDVSITERLKTRQVESPSYAI